MERRGAWWFKTHGGAFQRNGIPDLIACYRGWFLGIEVKNDKGRPSRLQQHELQCIKDAGGLGLVARGTAEVEEVLDSIDMSMDWRPGQNVRVDGKRGESARP